MVARPRLNSSIERLRVGPVTYVRLSGVIDETFSPKAMSEGLEDKIIIDLGRVTRMSSFGVRQWMEFAKSMPPRAQAIREGETKIVEFEKGKLKSQSRVTKTSDRNGTLVEFTPDEELFGKDFKFRTEFVEDMLWNYAFLNRGLTLTLNGKSFRSQNGLKDLLAKELSGEPLYPIIHLEGDDIEIALTHGNHYGEEYWSFVNGQHTTMGGTP